MVFLILRSCHCSWLKTLSLRSIQTDQRTMPRKRCQMVNQGLYSFPNPMPKNAVFPIKFMKWKLTGASKLKNDSKSPLPGSLGLNIVPKSMFKSILSKGETVGAQLSNLKRMPCTGLMPMSNTFESNIVVARACKFLVKSTCSKA